MLTYELEEEGCLVCLQGGLRVGRLRGLVRVILGVEERCSGELLDELFRGRVSNPVSSVAVNRGPVTGSLSGLDRCRLSV